MLLWSRLKCCKSKTPKDHTASQITELIPRIEKISQQLLPLYLPNVFRNQARMWKTLTKQQSSILWQHGMELQISEKNSGYLTNI
jgi:hypothetical protein